ncbi:MAG: hypothetical protein ACK5TK_15885 [Betaproteobacteria bacterium]
MTATDETPLALTAEGTRQRAARDGDSPGTPCGQRSASASEGDAKAKISSMAAALRAASEASTPYCAICGEWPDAIGSDKL